MKLNTFIDATYLKTASQATLTEQELLSVVTQFIEEAIALQVKLIMVRPEYVALAKQKIKNTNLQILVGTVIGFPFGNSTTDQKMEEATNAIANGADELDFVIDYERFKKNETDYIKKQITECTLLVLAHQKTIKWIVETAALTNNEIIRICSLIKNVVFSNCKEENYERVFVKSSTGFFQTKNNQPNGATIENITLLLENSFPLPVKASGGIKDPETAKKMIQLGVKRIGTSAVKEICIKA